jgi:hypothetical protein
MSDLNLIHIPRKSKNSQKFYGNCIWPQKKQSKWNIMWLFAGLTRNNGGNWWLFQHCDDGREVDWLLRAEDVPIAKPESWRWWEPERNNITIMYSMSFCFSNTFTYNFNVHFYQQSTILTHMQREIGKRWRNKKYAKIIQNKQKYILGWKTRKSFI